MRLLGFEITRAREKAAAQLSPVRSVWTKIFESFAGAWQRNVEVDQQAVLAYFAVYSCITLISADIGKLRLRLVERTSAGIWNEVEGPSPFWGRGAPLSLR